MFGNTFIADRMYSRHRWEKLPQQVQTLLSQTRPQHFYPNFPLIQDKVSWKPSLLVRSEFLGLFGNPFTANRMYSRERCEKLQQQVQTL